MSIRVGLRHMARSAVAKPIPPIPEPWIDDWDYRINIQMKNNGNVSADKKVADYSVGSWALLDVT